MSPCAHTRNLTLRGKDGNVHYWTRENNLRSRKCWGNELQLVLFANVSCRTVCNCLCVCFLKLFMPACVAKALGVVLVVRLTIRWILNSGCLSRVGCWKYYCHSLLDSYVYSKINCSLGIFDMWICICWDSICLVGVSICAIVYCHISASAVWCSCIYETHNMISHMSAGGILFWQTPKR